MSAYERRTLTWPGDGPPVTFNPGPVSVRYDVLTFTTSTGFLVLGPGRRVRLFPYPSALLLRLEASS